GASGLVRLVPGFEPPGWIDRVGIDAPDRLPPRALGVPHPNGQSVETTDQVEPKASQLQDGGVSFRVVQEVDRRHGGAEVRDAGPRRGFEPSPGLAYGDRPHPLWSLVRG